MKIKVFTFNQFLENTYLLYDETGECVIIDPGCYASFEREQLDLFIQENNLKVVKLLNTHCHIDHVLGNLHVKEKYGVSLLIHKTDLATLESVKSYAPVYGFPKYHPADADVFLEDGDEVTFGKSKLKVLFVPGHSPGHIAFYNDEQKILIGGDVLFKDSIGRTDLPGGDFNTLIQSIHNKIFTLGDDVEVFPGHGPSTKVGVEKVTNPFCGINAMT